MQEGPRTNRAGTFLHFSVTEVMSDAHANAGSRGLADAVDGVYLTHTAGGLPADKHDLVEYLKVDSSSLRGIVMATTGEGKQLMEGSIGE